MTDKKVAIIGAGFSGLTLAWALTKKNISCEIYESTNREGGMVGSKRDGILVEQAANAFLASENIEWLLKDIGVKAVTAGFRSKKRWIFQGKPKKMPLSFLAVLSGLSGFLKAKLTKELSPKTNESLASWSHRVLNKKFCDYLVSPAFQGVYGASADRLSATLILNSLFDKTLKSKKASLRGSLSAEGGMQEIIDGLVRYLTGQGVVIHKNSHAEVTALQQTAAAVVLATSLESAKQTLASAAPETAAKLKQVPVIPLATVTLKFHDTKRIQGFGCLFPGPEKFHALGVLFNSDVFPGRGDFSETWIISDVKSSDEALLEQIKKDRLRLVGTEEKIEKHFIRRWEKALPLYGAELEKVLSEKTFSEGLRQGVRVNESAKPLYLTGNYLGVIGLAKILDYNIRLSQRIKKELS